MGFENLGGTGGIKTKNSWIHPVSAIIVRELAKGEKTVSNLSSSLALPYNLVYRHVKNLEKEGLVESKRKERGIVYLLKDDLATKSLLTLSEVLRFREAVRAATPRVRTAALEVIDTVEKKFPELVADLYFYGSFAQGTARRGSDVDVVIVVPEEAVQGVEKEISDVLSAHTFVISRKMFEKKIAEGGHHIRNVLGGIRLRSPL